MKIPLYAKVALISINILFFVYVMIVGQRIIIPIVYAFIIAVLLNPLVNYLVRKHVNKLASISIVVVLAIIVVLGFFYIISSQVSMFSETFPQLKEKLNAISFEFVQWVSKKFRIHPSSINSWINDSEEDAINNLAIGEKITAAGRMMLTAMLLPVYLFMILYYKPLLLEFITRLFRSEYHIAIAEVMINIRKVIQNYLVGLFLEMVIIAILNSAGLLLLGIDYAIILGISGAILNIIPYIGGIIAIALPMVIAFVTKGSSYSILVFFIYVLIQFIDNHYIIPKIVASRVQLNALISVIVVLIGDAIWGIPGMFLSIPLTAIIKVIFDHIEVLKPWGFLLGNIVPTSPKISFIKQKK